MHATDNIANHKSVLAIDTLIKHFKIGSDFSKNHDTDTTHFFFRDFRCIEISKRKYLHIAIQKL
jgi:hypothetical protein